MRLPASSVLSRDQGGVSTREGAEPSISFWSTPCQTLLGALGHLSQWVSQGGCPRMGLSHPSPLLGTHCVRRVKAALVMEVGRLRPLVISRQIFLLMTSTRPPLSVTSRYSVYRSSTCLAMMGMRFTGVPSSHTWEREKGVG